MTTNELTYGQESWIRNETTGGLPGTRKTRDTVADMAAESDVVAAAPGAHEAFRMRCRLTRAMVENDAATDGADVFQAGALAALRPVDDETPVDAAQRVMHAMTMREGRRAAKRDARIDAHGDRCTADGDVVETMESRRARMALAIWGDLDRAQRQRVKRHLQGDDVDDVFRALNECGFMSLRTDWV